MFAIIETEYMNGNGKFNVSGIGSKKSVKESTKIAYEYFKYLLDMK